MTGHNSQYSSFQNPIIKAKFKMQEKIHIKRDLKEIPFGFKIQGGSEFSIPLSVLQVTPNSVAERCGLRSGDAILEINGVQTSHMDHNQAKNELIKCGNEFFLTVKRNAVEVEKPQHTPLQQLKSNPPVNLNSYTTPPAVKTDLTIEKNEAIKIGTSHNRAPMPFNKAVGNGIDYKSAKPTNWTPGDYTKWAPETPQSEPPTVTAVFHNQYNTPIGMYSDSNVFQEFQNQTKGIMPELPNSKPVSHGPSTVSSFSNQSYNPQPRSSNQPIGMNSLSMKMLNQGINEAQATSSQPPSIFDLKKGNPTGATVPSGFKSVRAPTALPPEQRHAPTRVEYQVQHVKQNWMEPK
ncbi:unnamed protein product [Brachionus calyciflorus]|uniref:PDZ domain-containing protein n=1 Tax=Brachionus calyciflorus TaxID=104777 RepID=A0A814J213_9BILA|nr:unnamed protein product [Brachionus calyciflorus]